jgi:hypothetical protein
LGECEAVPVVDRVGQVRLVGILLSTGALAWGRDSSQRLNAVQQGAQRLAAHERVHEVGWCGVERCARIAAGEVSQWVSTGAPRQGRAPAEFMAWRANGRRRAWQRRAGFGEKAGRPLTGGPSSAERF